MRNNNYFKRIFSMLLALILVIGMVPTTAFAAGIEGWSKEILELQGSDWVEKIELVYSNNEDSNNEDSYTLPFYKDTKKIDTAKTIKVAINDPGFEKKLKYKITYDFNKVKDGHTDSVESLEADNAEIQIVDGKAVEYIEFNDYNITKQLVRKRSDYSINGEKILNLQKSSLF